MMAGGDSGSAAKRRRERRLRSAWRHEQPSVAMALAAASHHSAQQDAAPRGLDTGTRAREVEEQVAHFGLRAQTAPPPGTRPGILADPGPQRSDRTVRHSAGAGLPTLALPSLAGSAAEAVDTSALTFLLGQNLERQKMKDEEEKRKEKEVQEKLVEELAKLDTELLAILRIPEDRRTPLQVTRLRAVTWQRVALQDKRRKRKKRRRRTRRRPRTRRSSTSDAAGRLQNARGALC